MKFVLISAFDVFCRDHEAFIAKSLVKKEEGENIQIVILSEETVFNLSGRVTLQKLETREQNIANIIQITQLIKIYKEKQLHIFLNSIQDEKNTKIVLYGGDTRELKTGLRDVIKSRGMKYTFSTKSLPHKKTW